jgi:hypothetical protein
VANIGDFFYTAYMQMKIPLKSKKNKKGSSEKLPQAMKTIKQCLENRKS